jgi:glyoxylase-like metal-dependent hydrolase (beta-lactamase superfamily II)
MDYHLWLLLDDQSPRRFEIGDVQAQHLVASHIHPDHLMTLRAQNLYQPPTQPSRRPSDYNPHENLPVTSARYRELL